MDFPIQMIAIRMGFSIFFKDHRMKLTKVDVFISQKIVFTSKNGTDHDEMLCFVAFHLGLTVCQSTHSGVFSKQRVMGITYISKIKNNLSIQFGPKSAPTEHGT